MSLQQACRLEAHFCHGELGPVCQGPHAEHGDLSIVSWDPCLLWWHVSAWTGCVYWFVKQMLHHWKSFYCCSVLNNWFLKACASGTWLFHLVAASYFVIVELLLWLNPAQVLFLPVTSTVTDISLIVDWPTFQLYCVVLQCWYCERFAPVLLDWYPIRL